MSERGDAERAATGTSLFASGGRAWLYAVPVGLTTIANLIGTAFMPYFLARAPLVLIALSPLFRHLVLVAPGANAVSLFAVAVPRHFLPDPFMYLLGREYGPRAVEWAEANSPRLGQMVRLLERIVGKIGVVALLISPDLIVSTLSGAARVSFPLFVVFNIAGTFITVFVARWFGAAFEHQIRAVVLFFQSHLVLVTVTSALVVFGMNEWSRRRSDAR